MRNLIDRQAAIDAIYETFCYAYCDNCEKEMNEDLCGDCHRKYQNWAASKKIISKTINSLPSAEPEIIFCKDCVKRNNMGFCTILQNNIHGIATSWYKPEDDDFCSRSERRAE